MIVDEQARDINGHALHILAVHDPDSRRHHAWTCVGLSRFFLGDQEDRFVVNYWFAQHLFRSACRLHKSLVLPAAVLRVQLAVLQNQCVHF